MAPFQPFTSMKPVRTVPASAMSAVTPCVWKSTFLKLTRPTSVASLLTMTFAVCSAMKQMKRPMPAATARLSVSGMELNMPSRTGVSDSARKTMPSTNTARSANCQL